MLAQALPPSLQPLLRPSLHKLVPYSSARSEFGGRAEVFLDANENPWRNGYGTLALNRYPDPRQQRLRQAYAAYAGLQPGQVWAGHGSDEAIDLLLRAFAQPGQHSVAQVVPTYGMYAVSAAINDLQVISIPLGSGFQLDADAVLSALQPHTRLVFLCSPNNPTGNLLQPTAIERILKGFSGLVVVDEAYVEFAQANTWAQRLAQQVNLVVLRTLSKAWGLAGLRVGFALAHPGVVQVLDALKPPYNLGLPAQARALQFLENPDRMHQQVQGIVANRQQLAQFLASDARVQHVYPSDANFLLVKVNHADALYDHLLAHGMVVRNRSRQPGCEGCLRISIGTPQENKRLMRIWTKFPA